jgi:hypothetical protein
VAADVVISVKEQKLGVYDRSGSLLGKYPVSTSRYGVSDRPGTYGTPAGMHEVVAKIGHGAPAGAVFKSRHLTGEVIAPGTPGRDPIVSRIMWLRGLESQNRNAYNRAIYIHGTADEAEIGRPVSFGCIRMKSHDVIDLFNRLPIGSRVLISEAALPTAVAASTAPVAAPRTAPPAHPPLLLDPESSRQKPPMLALNSAPKPPPAARTSLRSTMPPTEAKPKRKLPPGSTYVPADSGSPGIILRSTRSAMEGVQN